MIFYLVSTGKTWFHCRVIFLVYEVFNVIQRNKQLNAKEVYVVNLRKEGSSVCITSKNRLLVYKPVVAYVCMGKKRRAV